jgi:F-type H+-transporting ATPase subunit a
VNTAGLGLIPLESEGGFSVNWREIFTNPGYLGTSWLTKPMIELIISVILVVVIWVIAARNLKIVPKKGQWFFEYLYDFIRNGLARDIIGHGYQRWVPLLMGIFFLILVNNWFGEFFYFMRPTFGNVGFAYGMALAVWFIYIYAGFSTHGLKYLKYQLVPDGVPGPLLILIVPLEFLSNFITRPFTLSVRVFANMFAGHMQVFVFVVGGTFLLTYADNVLYNIAGVFSWVLGIVIMLLELFIGFLQAYIFTILSAQYISSSIAAAH